MKRMAIVVLVAMLLVPGVALAGSSTDAALGLGAFAVFNQIISGTGIFGGFVHPAPRPVVVAPQPVYVTPAPVYATAPPIFVAPQPVYVSPAPVIVAPRPVYVAPRPVVVYPAPVYYRSHVWYAPAAPHGHWRRHR